MQSKELMVLLVYSTRDLKERKVKQPKFGNYFIFA
jgi:hypothetical protein